MTSIECRLSKWSIWVVLLLHNHESLCTWTLLEVERRVGNTLIIHLCLPHFIPSDTKIHRPIHGSQQKYMRKIPGENKSKDEEENMEVDSR